jgi:hypothetical protein
MGKTEIEIECGPGALWVDALLGAGGRSRPIQLRNDLPGGLIFGVWLLGSTVTTTATAIASLPASCRRRWNQRRAWNAGLRSGL